MNAQTYINIGGQTIETPTDLPDRKFRDAWVLDNGAVVLDPVKRAEIAKGLFQQAVEAHVEAKAAERGYSSGALRGLSQLDHPKLGGGSGSLHRMARQRVGACLRAAHAGRGGQRAEPTVADLVAELPPIVWPA
jgi:hypothetical protein